jgi:hypothetical protein
MKATIGVIPADLVLAKVAVEITTIADLKQRNDLLT